MSNYIKELIVVLIIATMVFRVARPVALQFVQKEDLSRRLLVWYALTIACFLSPNFWVYTFVALPLAYWAGRKDSNPVALYLLLLHVAPPISVAIPILGNNGLIPLDNYRILAIAILIPLARAIRRKHKNDANRMFGAMDILLLAYGALQVTLYTPPDLPHHAVIPDSATNELRRAVLFLLDTYLLYCVVSRACDKREKIVDAIASFSLISMVMAAIAVFENARNWLVYFEIGGRWGAGPVLYLGRNDAVRAEVSAGHALSLGLLLAVATGLTLYLKSHIPSRFHRAAITIVLWGGLLATISRGPWLGAAVIYFTYLALGPRAPSTLLKATFGVMVLAAIIATTPIGDRILAVLPVMGKGPDATILYRQLLAERGWQLVFQHPLFGDQFPWLEMEDLRQGEGIIDIVNTYLGVALTYGLVGLALFDGFMLLAVARVYACIRAARRADPDSARLGMCLIASIAGVMVMIQSASFNLGAPKMFYVLAALATAYARLSASKSSQLAAVRLSGRRAVD